jgi:hypothetical protein
MVYGGPGFLAVVLLGFSPTSLSRQRYLSQSSYVSPVELTDRRGRGVGLGRSQIIPRESLALNKSLNMIEWIREAQKHMNPTDSESDSDPDPQH